MSNIKEKRFVSPEKSVRVEQNEKGQTVLSGYGSVFGQRSKLIFERGKFFYETIERTAFDGVLNNREGLNVVMTYNHDRSQMLGRTSSGTLNLSTDDYGLRYEVVLPDTQLARDLSELIKRGDIFESSFIFSVDKEGERWQKTEEGWLRNIISVNGLYDTSLVVDGAYANTSMQLTERQLEIIDQPEPVEEKVDEVLKENIQESNSLNLIYKSKELEILKNKK